MMGEQAKILSIIADELEDLGNDLDSDIPATPGTPVPVIYVDGEGHGYAMEESGSSSFATRAPAPSTSGSAVRPSPLPATQSTANETPARSATGRKPRRTVKYTHEASLNMQEEERNKNMRLMDLEEQIKLEKKNGSTAA
ncbi:hypothetical protein E2C01_046598 [Portunus trituberculatus]|uniref:Uncharacterized protein n=1 Tax=Portunus trituberculatus TaxID=210409 RepID=A0A5B7G1E3_PORTR|nr:hypothetical protein [Portunus trituberculatus]